MSAEVFLDFEADPGLQPCDRCHRIKLCQWFGALVLCPECLEPRTEGAHGEIVHDLIEIIGLDAIGKAAERLSALQAQANEMRKALAEMRQFLDGFVERGEARAHRIGELLERAPGG